MREAHACSRLSHLPKSHQTHEWFFQASKNALPHAAFRQILSLRQLPPV
jgi:hypothetical protein